MNKISEYMTRAHTHCDELFSIAENLALKSGWREVQTAFEEFAGESERHFRKEEGVLFPEVERLMQGPAGPTQVMRMEHQRMRALITNLRRLMAEEKRDEFLGEAETLLVMMQQHNMKEEQILYPMTDRLIGESSASVIEAMERI